MTAMPPAASSRMLASTVAAGVYAETVVKRSRFLARVEPVTSAQDADAIVAAIRREHWDARHHCVAMILGPYGEEHRSSDDGEHSGTAGAPMLEALRQSHLTDVVAVVTRYFGGVLLGTGGLARAYGSSVGRALDEMHTVARAEVVRVSVETGHDDAGRTENMMREWAQANAPRLRGTRFVGTTYDDRAHLELLVPPAGLHAFEAELAAFSAGKLGASELGQEIVDVVA